MIKINYRIEMRHIYFVGVCTPAKYNYKRKKYLSRVNNPLKGCIRFYCKCCETSIYCRNITPGSLIIGRRGFSITDSILTDTILQKMSKRASLKYLTSKKPVDIYCIGCSAIIASISPDGWLGCNWRDKLGFE